MTLAPPRPRRLFLGCSALVVSAVVLSACTASNNGLRRDVATQLQARVLEVTQASSQNDPASALKALDGLEADLAAAQSKGRVSEERRRSITTVATAVRADLNQAVAAQQAKAAEDARIAAGQTAAQSPSPAPEATAPAAPAPAPAPDNAAGNGANTGKNSNSEKGKGKD